MENSASAESRGVSPGSTTSGADDNIRDSGNGNGLDNRYDSFQRDVAEEKKTADPFDGCQEPIQFPPGQHETPLEAASPDGVSSHLDADAFSSPIRSFATNSEFTPERLRDFHQSVREKSTLIGDMDAEQTIIDTDGTTSEASDSALSPKRLAGLLLSPTILTRRHRQAIHAIENRKWDQVSYLLSANPWLAEMPEISTNQYLLHKLASFGAGDSQNHPAPEQLCLELVKMYAAAHKFDNEGNLPLHMASAGGNIRMITILGDRFPSGASVRNEDGMLPLHLALSSPAVRHNDSVLLETVSLLLGFFPGALAVMDNSGNLPLHLAAEFLDGDEGVDVVNLLLDEADKQLKAPTGIRFRNRIKADDAETASMATESATTTDISVEDENEDEMLPPSMVENDAGETPLLVAVRRFAGSEIIEAFAIGPGGRQSAMKVDMDNNSTLHRMLQVDFLNVEAFKSILKVGPETALQRNMERRLPIEVSTLFDVIFASARANLLYSSY